MIIYLIFLYLEKVHSSNTFSKTSVMSSMFCRLKYLEISFVLRVWIEARNYCFLLFLFFSDLRRFWWGCANKFLKKKTSRTFSAEQFWLNSAPSLRRNKTYTSSLLFSDGKTYTIALLLSDGKKQLKSIWSFQLCAPSQVDLRQFISCLRDRLQVETQNKNKIKINERMNDIA